jgi:hypothetical protein
VRLFFAAIGIALTLAGCTYDYEGARRCSNGLKDGDETEVDCGGSCQTCPNLTRFWMELLGPQPPKRAAEALVYEPDPSRVLLFSGYKVGQFEVPAVPTDDTWTLDGEVWTQHHPVNRPTTRSYAMAGYDEVEHRTVVAGGSGTDVDNSWAWNGNNWSFVDDLVGPHDSGGMVWAGNVLLMFAAKQNAAPEVLALDGMSWNELTTFHGPSSLLNSSGFAYDSARKLTVVFLRNGQTWEYDNTTQEWTENAHAGGPGVRCGVAMAYDEQRRVTVLFGGSGADQCKDAKPLFADTWEYDGEGWLQVATTGTPPVRFHARMVYDSSAQRMVLFGGNGASFDPIKADTWTYYTLGTPCSTQADCERGYCHDDVCCEKESCPPDQACNSKAQSGTCTVRE